MNLGPNTCRPVHSSTTGTITSAIFVSTSVCHIPFVDPPVNTAVFTQDALVLELLTCLAHQLCRCNVTLVTYCVV